MFKNGRSVICSDQGLELTTGQCTIHCRGVIDIPSQRGSARDLGLVAVRHIGQLTLSLVARIQCYS